MLSAGAIPGRGRPLIAMLRGLFCRHQWDMSRSRKGTFVCRACGARRA
ncbi:hypothetical protein [Brevundimonas sp.]|nr:hypothetical protein [Brevundimonas sp.]HYC69098.1 hypothetical protein [Brevundimonas sp.]